MTAYPALTVWQPWASLIAAGAAVVLGEAVLPLSSVLCLATLGEPIRDDALTAALGVGHLADSDRQGHTNWGWPLTEIVRLEPFVPARGRQGIWTWQHDG